MEKKGQYINRKKKPQSKSYLKERNNKVSEEIKEVKKTENSKLQIDKSKIFVGLITVLLITFIVYIPTFKNEITNWDDDKYIIENPLIEKLDSETISKMFFTGTGDELYWMGNYHPLTMLSLNVNYQMLSGDDVDEEGKVTNPFIFQLTNILLHLINTLLVFFVMLILFRNFNIAIITSLFFGISTLHVESVAWISERKDVLYTAFFLLSLLFYAKYTEKYQIKNIVLSFIFFLLSSLAKGQAVSLAVTLVAVDYLRNRKLLDVKLILEKSLFFIVALLFGLIAIKAQKHGMAMQDIQHYGFLKRILIAGWGFTMYILKLIVPFNLSAIYPYPDIINRTIPTYFVLGLIPSALVAYLIIYYFKKSREITFALAFYVINIALLLQIIPVGSAIMADRYAYIPSIGLFLLSGIVYQKTLIQKPQLKNLMLIVLVCLSVFWCYTTFERTKVWKDSMTLWNDVVEKQPKAVVAWNNRGSENDKKAAVEKENQNLEKYSEYKLQALADFTIAIEGKPDYHHAFYNRGTASKDFGETLNDTSYYYKALEDFNSAIRIDLNFAEAYQNRAITYELLGNLEKALSDYNRAIEINPGKFEFYINRGVIKGKMGNLDEAIKDFNLVIANEPNNASAFSNRGLANDGLGKTQEALNDYNTSIDLDSTSFTAFYNRALIYRRQGNFEAAINDLTKVLELEPGNLNALIMRGTYYVDFNRIDEACKDFSLAAKSNSEYAAGLVMKYCNQN